MSTRGRILFAIAAMLIAGAYVFPLWSVYLHAPQYPEGLGMRIGASTITGLKPNDLDNINNLNHYIGMKRIVPAAIPELRFMPIVLAALAAFGLAVAATGRRLIGRLWIVSFVVLAAAGLADFWKWEYDYGHDLDYENAIIKIPGMNYQPPLIGSKQLLNFRATSVPDVGAMFLATSLGLGVAALLIDRRRTTQTAMPRTAAGAIAGSAAA